MDDERRTQIAAQCSRLPSYGILKNESLNSPTTKVDRADYDNMDNGTTIAGAESAGEGAHHRTTGNGVNSSPTRGEIHKSQ